MRAHLLLWLLVVAPAAPAGNKTRGKPPGGGGGTQQGKARERPRVNETVRRQVEELLNAEPFDWSAAGGPDDTDLQIARDLNDTLGERVLLELRSRVRARPPKEDIHFDGESKEPMPALKLPIINQSAARASLRRMMRAAGTATPATAPPRRTAPHTPPSSWSPSASPTPQRRKAKNINDHRNFVPTGIQELKDLVTKRKKVKNIESVEAGIWELERWAGQGIRWSPPAVPRKIYTFNPNLSETWISRLFYYWTPGITHSKMWCFRMMQENVYRVQHKMKNLNRLVARYSGNKHFQVAYTFRATDHLVNDIRLFWTYLRRRFYYVAAGKYINTYSNYVPTLNENLSWWAWLWSDYEKLTDKNWRGLGRFRTNDVWKHLVYYSMAVRRFVDCMYISSQITSFYENHLKEQKRLRVLAYNIRKGRLDSYLRI